MTVSVFKKVYGYFNIRKVFSFITGTIKLGVSYLKKGEYKKFLLQTINIFNPKPIFIAVKRMIESIFIAVKKMIESVFRVIKKMIISIIRFAYFSCGFHTLLVKVSYIFQRSWFYIRTHQYKIFLSKAIQYILSLPIIRTLYYTCGLHRLVVEVAYTTKRSCFYICSGQFKTLMIKSMNYLKLTTSPRRAKDALPVPEE